MAAIFMDLPQDFGADYRCTFIVNYNVDPMFNSPGSECRIITSKGLTEEAYAQAKKVVPEHVSFMRPLCSKHRDFIGTYL